MIFLFLLLALIWLFLYYFEIPFFFPVCLFFLSWTVLFLFFYLIPFDYFHKSFSPKVCFLVFSCLALFFIGSLSGFLFLNGGERSLSNNLSDKPIIPNRFLNIFCILMALVYCVFSIPYSFKKLSEAKGSENVLTDLRAQHWEDFGEGKVSIEKRVLTFTRPFALLFSVSLCFLSKRKIFLGFGFFCLLSLFFENSTTAGRFLMGIVMFLIIYLFLVSFLIKNFFPCKSIGLNFLIKNPYFLSVIGISFFAALLALALFPMARNTLLLDNPDIFIEYMYSATISIPLTNIERSMLYGLAYLSDPLAKLTFFVEEANINRWYAGGLYSFPHIFEPITKIAGGNSKWLSLRSEIALILESINTQPNPWATGIRDIVIDFGFVGASITMMILGILSTWASFYLLRLGSPLALILLSIIAFWLAAFPFVNVSMMGPFFNFFLVVFSLLLVNRMTKIDE